MFRLIFAAFVAGFAILRVVAEVEVCVNGVCSEPLDEDFVKLSLHHALSMNNSEAVEGTLRLDSSMTFEQTMDAVKGHWTYSNIDAWAQTFPDCKGNRQSPVDIVTATAAKGEAWFAMSAQYAADNPANLMLKNNGHALQVNGDFGILQLSDGTYEAKQFHFHFPSEHSVNGKLMAGEMQIVHQRVAPAASRGTDGLAVVGVFLTAAASSPFFDQLGFATPPNEGAANPIGGAIDLSQVLQKQLNGSYYYYQGSLTTPPCSETVHWYVMKTPLEVSNTAIGAFKTKFPNPMNNRPARPMNSRLIGLIDAGTAGSAVRADSGPPGPPGPHGAPR